MSDKLLHRKDTDAITTLTLNSPNSLNALSNDMLDKLQFELDSLKRDPNIRVIIINGSGKAFCAGHDLKEMTLVGKIKMVEKQLSKHFLINVQK